MTATINNYTNDYITDSGTRICTPLYLDLTTTQRKELLNAVRSKAAEMTVVPVKTRSGISVETASSNLNQIEAFLGCSLEVLRSLLFQRGGLASDLVLKLQAVTGLELVSLKEIDAAYKARAKLIKDFAAVNTFSNE
jgi:CxxC motif-containing protein